MLPLYLCALLLPQVEAERPKVAVFPVVSRDKLDKGTTARAQAAIEEALRQLNVRPIDAGTLSKGLKKKASSALERCGSDLKCIAGLGTKVRADDVLLTQGAVSDRGLELTFLVISVKAKDMRGSAKALLPPGEGAGALIDSLRELYPYVPVAKPEASDSVASVPPPLPMIRPLTSAPIPAEQATSELEEIQATSAPAATALAPRPQFVDAPTEKESSTSWLTVVGVTGAGLAAAVAGTGLYFGSQVETTRGKLVRDGSMTQLDAVATNDQADQYAQRANFMFMVSGGILTLALTAFGVELASD